MRANIANLRADFERLTGELTSFAGVLERNQDKLWESQKTKWGPLIAAATLLATVFFAAFTYHLEVHRRLFDFNNARKADIQELVSRVSALEKAEEKRK